MKSGEIAQMIGRLLYTPEVQTSTFRRRARPRGMCCKSSAEEADAGGSLGVTS